MKRNLKQRAKRGAMLTGMVLSTLFIASCASSPEAPEGALDVREELTALQNNPSLADRARVELREAEEAVELAEQPLKESDAALTEHRIYMAEQAVAIAEARATTRYAEDQRVELAEQRDAARLKARTREAERARNEAALAQSSQAEAASAAAQKEEEYQRRIDALEAEITDRGVVLTLGDVLFATGSAELQEGSSSNLNKLVSFLNEYPDRNAQIEGHTDNVGSAELNQGLSERRAVSVKAYLTEQGISSGRLSSKGLGMSRPLANNDTVSGRAQNRRVEIIIENPSRS